MAAFDPRSDFGFRNGGLTAAASNAEGLKSCECPLRSSALPGFCPGGAEVVRRMASQNFRGPHDEVQIKSKASTRSTARIKSLGTAN